MWHICGRCLAPLRLPPRWSCCMTSRACVAGSAWPSITRRQCQESRGCLRPASRSMTLSSTASSSGSSASSRRCARTQTSTPRSGPRRPTSTPSVRPCGPRQGGGTRRRSGWSRSSIGCRPRRAFVERSSGRWVRREGRREWRQRRSSTRKATTSLRRAMIGARGGSTPAPLTPCT